MGAVMQVQRWKLRRQMPWLGQLEAVTFFILAPAAVVLLIAAIAGGGSGGTSWIAFAAVALAAAQTGCRWRYIAGAPTGDEPPLPTNPRASVVAAYRWQWAYAIVLLVVGVSGIMLGIVVSLVHFIWGILCLALGVGLVLGLWLLVRPRLAQVPED